MPTKASATLTPRTIERTRDKPMQQPLTRRAFDSRTRIQEAATAVFARQGFHGTSTREIARLANLSEVTLFRHYESKEAVFLGALESNLDLVANRSSFLGKVDKTLRFEDVLLQILALLHDVAIYMPQVVKLIMIAYLEVHGAAEEMCSMRLGPVFRGIAGYLDANMKTGRLKSVSPDLAAATMTLSAIAQAAIQRFKPSPADAHLRVQKTVDEFSVFWKSMLISEPDDPAAKRGTGSPLSAAIEAAIGPPTEA